MEPKDYILKSLESLNSADKNEIPKTQGKLLEEIEKLVLSKKFRKYAIQPVEYLDHIKNVIELSVAKNEPIKFTLVFGGYKLWRLKESPEADWGELFSLIYYAKWLIPVCKIYKPGVWFDFYSDDVILEIMDNVPRTDTKSYVESFKNLLTFIKPYLPQNFKFSLNRVADQYESYDAFKKELEESIQKTQKELGGLPQLNDEQKAQIELNVRLKPGQENDPKWREKVFLIHEGYTKVSKRRPYYRTDDKIFVITRPIDNSIAVGTTKNTVAKFWVGIGALKKTNEGYFPYVLSPNQIKSTNFQTEELKIRGLDGKNFEQIKIFRN